MLLVALVLPKKNLAQDEGFLYGKVFTEDGKVYEGPLRWGKEEVYWTDLFNASKERNENLRYLSDRDREILDEQRYEGWFSWDNRLSNWFGWENDHDRGHRYIHQFSCQFGEIKTVRPQGKNYVEIEMRNGKKFGLDGNGYNDVGTNLRVADKELGEAEIFWSRIDRIEFMDAPKKLEQRLGDPLYGTVKAFGETFTGFIQWDHDERLTTDKLDGDSEDGDVSIAFGKIKSIQKRGNRSLVTLLSGREILLHGSNDVSSGHRGVIVMNRSFPAVDIPWDEFDEITFEAKPSSALPSYSDFTDQEELRGTVKTHGGKKVTGKIIYDLDEQYRFELLQGKEGEFEYSIPFRNIRKIVARSTHRCQIQLRDGKTITLDDAQDVNDRNQGILVFEGDKPVYIPWYDVDEIEFL